MLCLGEEAIDAEFDYLFTEITFGLPLLRDVMGALPPK